MQRELMNQIIIWYFHLFLLHWKIILLLSTFFIVDWWSCTDWDKWLWVVIKPKWMFQKNCFSDFLVILVRISICLLICMVDLMVMRGWHALLNFEVIVLKFPSRQSTRVLSDLENEASAWKNIYGVKINGNTKWLFDSSILVASFSIFTLSSNQSLSFRYNHQNRQIIIK